ncbi:hypothetical protein RUM43_008065 [Polyplax serrata]|uniref:Uncharacterized protein n=1 Tax=Polyplax serrata TaxID=468196 RepID=A0AAN8P6J3_POLSC
MDDLFPDEKRMMRSNVFSIFVFIPSIMEVIFRRSLDAPRGRPRERMKVLENEYFSVSGPETDVEVVWYPRGVRRKRIYIKLGNVIFVIWHTCAGNEGPWGDTDSTLLSGTPEKVLSFKWKKLKNKMTVRWGGGQWLPRQNRARVLTKTFEYLYNTDIKSKRDGVEKKRMCKDYIERRTKNESHGSRSKGAINQKRVRWT